MEWTTVVLILGGGIILINIIAVIAWFFLAKRITKEF